MRFKQYIIETYEQDKKFRKEASNAYNKLIKYLKSKNPQMVRHEVTSGMFIPFSDVDSKYKDLIVSILPTRKGEGGYGSFNIYKVVQVEGMPTKWDYEGNYRDLKKIKIDKNLFIHEFIHYLDDKRGAKTQSAQLYKSGSMKEYFTTPTEYNAYYQEIISFIEDKIEKEPEKWLKSFDQFMKTLQKYSKKYVTIKEYMDSLTDTKYRKKFMKRLYDFYESVKDKK